MHRQATSTHGLTRLKPDLKEVTTFPFIVLFVINHGRYIQMSFVPGLPILKIGTPNILESHYFLCKPMKWDPKQSCNPLHKLSNDMWHATYMQVNQGDSWVSTVQSQIVNLILDLSFGHNLCFKYANESYETILDIYVSRAFQWYNENFNPMSFDPSNRFSNIQKSIRTPTPKVGAHMGVCEFILSHSPTLQWAWNVTPELHSRPAPLQAFALVTNFCFGHKLLLWSQAQC